MVPMIQPWVTEGRKIILITTQTSHTPNVLFPSQPGHLSMLTFLLHIDVHPKLDYVT